MAPKIKKIPEKKKTSKSARAGLIISVGRVHRLLRNGNYARRVGIDASLYLTGAIEYLCSEIFELAAKAADDNKRLRITPRHIMMAIRVDDELNNLLAHVIIKSSGVLPQVNAALLPKKTSKNVSKATDNDASSQEY